VIADVGPAKAPSLSSFLDIKSIAQNQIIESSDEDHFSPNEGFNPEKV
jgi:hypothetical protein